MLSSSVTISMFEDDIEKLYQEKSGLIYSRDNKEDEEVNIQTAINYARYFMEHPADSLLGGENPIKNGYLFGLLFKERPTYEDLAFGTPKLSPLFSISSSQNLSKSDLAGLGIPASKLF